MKDSPFNQRIAELDDEITAREMVLRDLKQQRAEYHCPFKLGDILVDKNNRKCRLAQISPDYYDGYTLKGRYLKKDGTPGQRAKSLWDWDEWQKP